MATCVVHLDNFHGQYYPGSTITGRVICSVTKPVNIRGKYPVGRHEYPFSFDLPKNLPGTFQGSKGWIKYNVKGKMVIPFGFDYQDIKEIKVVSEINLNETPGVQMTPVTYTQEKNVRWLFKSCGLITLKMYLEKNAFVKGERVKVRLELSNMSTESVIKVELKMLTVMESNVTHPSKDSKFDKEILAAASDTGVGAHGQRTYTFDLVVPDSTVLANFGICRLFKQWTKIEVIASLPGLHSNLELTAPIYLGTTLSRGGDNFQSNTHFSAGSYSTQASAPPPPTTYPPTRPTAIPVWFYDGSTRSSS